jgi:EmrB/QacA subfamily drug resistance transporter
MILYISPVSYFPTPVGIAIIKLHQFHAGMINKSHRFPVETSMNMTATSPKESDPYRNKWAVMVPVSMGIFLATIDGSIVNVALPTLETGLRTSFSLVQWVVVAYLLVITVLLLSFGRWADMVGKKGIYTAGFIIFTLGSLMCGLCTHIFALIASRVFQAIGAAMIMALGMAIVTEAFPPWERGKALGMTGLIVSIGIIAGPTLGGLILGHWSWNWIFFVNIPVGIIGILMVIRFVPNRVPGIKQKFDFGGALTLLISLSALTIGLTLGEINGFNYWMVYALLVVFILALVVFIKVEITIDQPMIELVLFKNRLFTVNLITGFLTFMAAAGSNILMPYYLQNVKNYSPQTTGLLMAVVPVALGIMSPISGSLSDRFGSRSLTVIGLGLLTLGYYLVSTLQVDTSALGYVLRFLPIGLGAGIFQSPNNSEIMSSAPRERLGVASGLLSLTRTLGQTTGISILGALWTGQVFAHLGGIVSMDATSAPALIQVNALQATFHLVTVGVLAAFGLGLWAWRMERKQTSDLATK